jgi:hypothetical protein
LLLLLLLLLLFILTFCLTSPFLSVEPTL